MYIKFISLIALLALLFTGCSEQKEERIEKPKVKIVKILDLKNAGTYKPTFEYPAEINAFLDSTMAFEVNGKIVKFYYKEGQKVKKGSVIAKLDDDIYKANYNSARANFSQANIDYQRYKKLYKSNAVAKVEVEKQRQNLDVNKARLQVAKKNLDETKLVAEFDGILAKKLVADFARISAKQSIVRLQDNSSYKIKIFVPESDILQVPGELSVKHISEIADFYVSLGDSTDTKYEAKMIDISTTAEKVTRTFEVTLQMQTQKNVNILPGMTAKVKVIAKEQVVKRVYIPYKAVFSDESKNSFVWAVSDDNKLIKQELKLGMVKENKVEVLKGLEGVKKIVTSGIRFLALNDEVRAYEKIGN